MRAFTSRFTRPDGIGLLDGKRIVPFDISYPLSSAECLRLIAAVIGYMLVCSFQAAYQTTKRPSSLTAGIP